MAVNKKKVIKSLDSLSDDLRDLLKRQYPTGYEGSISRIKNAKNEPIFVFPLETEDATYLIKVPATKNSDGEYDVESTPENEFDNSNENDNYNEDDSYNNSNNSEDEDYEGRSGSSNREASYDPDFDG